MQRRQLYHKGRHQNLRSDFLGIFYPSFLFSYPKTLFLKNPRVDTRTPTHPLVTAITYYAYFFLNE